jgi:8-oxo-dGTP diphosphatase
MSQPPGILARGPWAMEEIHAAWDEDHYAPTSEATHAADAAIQALADRGSPSHDGLAARLVEWSTTPEGLLALRLQPIRWGLRLVEDDASSSIASLCVVRDAAGRWLAGRRAAWLSSWPGRWALGAGGAVDLGESPADTLVRELREEWSVAPARVRGEALVRLPHQMVLFVGQAWLAEGVDEDLVMDSEHDEFAWWPADIDAWPDEADAPLRYMARLLDGAGE